MPSVVIGRFGGCSPGSLESPSKEDRGLSSCAGGMVSKIECCEIEAVSALELLSLTG